MFHVKHQHWLSSRAMTVVVEVEDGIVVWAPPIARKFVGGPFDRLIEWMDRQGGLRRYDYTDDTLDTHEIMST